MMTYGTDTSHGMVDTTGAKTSLNNLETAAFTKHNVVQRYADILEGDVTVTVRGVVVAKDTQHAVDGDSRGVCRDEDDTLLLVGAGVVLV
jgi:hypothetical protein